VTPAGPAQVRAALDRSGALNPLLGMGSGDDGTPADAFAAGPLVDAVGARLGTGERRVAASMVVLGYAARLVGPTLAVLFRDGILLDVRPGRVRYAYHPDTGFRLSLPEPAARPGPVEAGLVEGWHGTVVDGHLARIVDAVGSDTRIAAPLLWGNVASGVAATLRVLGVHRPALLDRGPLRDSGTYRPDGTFRRRTCCLYYRLQGGGKCGDCPLIHRRNG
jgi:ferric iron reductase protein FhuF